MEYAQAQLNQLFSWLAATDVDREMFKEGMRLITAIKHRLEDPDKLAYSEFYLPIVLNDGCIPEGMNVAQLCANLHIDNTGVSQHLTKLLENFQEGVGSIIDTKEASHILRLSDRDIRRLIANRELPATKEKRLWRIERINAWRLMAKRLGVKT